MKCLLKAPGDSMSRICAGRLFHNIGAAAENDLAPKVASMRPLGRSKTIEQCDLSEYAEQDLMLTKSLM